MKQHPVPQQISSYQFRLVGDMTLKQFFQLAGGFLVALAIYSTNIYGFIKWPLMFFVVLIGIAFAFLPFKERPLSAWIVSFFKAIYSPTEFAWKRYETLPQYFQNEALDKQALSQAQAEKGKKESVEQAQSFMTSLEEAEKALLGRFALLFKGIPLSTQGQVVQQKPEKVKPVYTPQQEIKIEQVATPQVVVEQKPVLKEEKTATKDFTRKVAPTLSSTQQDEAQKAEFSIEAAPHIPPETPNTIVGQVMNPQGLIVEGAILEVKDDQGRPVRALKTNKLGHFIVVTPLQKGTYQVETEKEGLVFDNITFDAMGDIIPPIAIRAKQAVSN